MESLAPWAGRFQSTHPARGATAGFGRGRYSPAISIHAPREGCDGVDKPYNRHCGHFNPRTPRGVRRKTDEEYYTELEFQSTHPARGATTWLLVLDRAGTIFQSTHPARGATRRRWWRGRTAPPISIHAPREGCDAPRLPGRKVSDDFNPRTPRGVRRGSPTICKLFWHFNPRTPRGVRRKERRRFSH